jgi:transposase
MSMCSPYRIVLTDQDRAALTALAHRPTAAYRLVLRARIVLAAAQQTSNAAIAVETGLHVDTVRKWRRRFVQGRLPGLSDRRRSGRPPSFTPVQVAEVKQLACTLPAETGVALSRWSSSDLAAETVRRGVTATISASTIRRWLSADAIKPWQHRSWIFPRDPDFATKAGRVLDLYARC